MDGHGRRLPTNELPAERLSAEAARGMFPKVSRDSMAKAALDAMNRPNCTPEASPFTTALELEVGKDLEDKIKTTQQQAGPNDPNNSELSEGLGEQAGAYVILPTPGGHNHHNSGEAPAMNFDAIQGATAGAIQFVSGEGARGHTFAPAGHSATTTVDLARMKAGETIAEATSAAMQVGKEAGDFVAGAAGHKWF